MKRPTHRDIALIANVSHVAVSLALRGHPSIPKQTRERIEKVAREIGYRPDPALQALMVYRRRAKPSSYQGTLAWINNYQSNPERLKQQFSKYFLGAQERCAELGYQLEEFRLVDLEMNFKRLSKILRARNIQGLLFAPQQAQRHITRTNFEWEDFSVIAFGFSLMRPRLDVVTNAQFDSTRLAVRKLRSLGYRRIGFAVEALLNEKSGQNFLAGFLIEYRHFVPSERVPALLIPGRTDAERTKSFEKWMLRQKPDVVLLVSGIIPEYFQSSSGQRRYDCGLAIMDVPDTNPDLSGINQNNLTIGRTAVDTLVAKIHANERGIPTTPRRILIEGSWTAGNTAPRITNK